MPTFKLKINLQEKSLEVEGEEDAVMRVYEDFKRNTLEQKLGAEEQAVSEKHALRQKEAYEVVPNLSFVAEEGKRGLREFVLEKRPQTAFERNAVFVYYLQKIKEVQNITPNHIYSCYKHLSIKFPAAFRQSIVDTSYKKQYIDTTSLQNILLTLNGENFVEHELPK